MFLFKKSGALGDCYTELDPLESSDKEQKSHCACILILSVTAFPPLQVHQLLFLLCIPAAHGKRTGLKLLKFSRFKMP